MEQRASRVREPGSLFSANATPIEERLADGACCGATASWSAGSPLPLSHGMRRPESLPQYSRNKRPHNSIVRPACERCGRRLFPIPTSLRPAYSSRHRRSKACHPERGPRSEGPRNTPRNVQLSQGALEADDLPFQGGKCTLPPSVYAFIGVALVRSREVLRFEDSAQDDKKGAPFRVRSLVVEFVGNGKRGLPHSKTLARLPRRICDDADRFGASRLPVHPCFALFRGRPRFSRSTHDPGRWPA